jgi:hypothetical protein
MRAAYNGKVVVGMILQFSDANSVWILLRIGRLRIRRPCWSHQRDENVQNGTVNFRPVFYPSNQGVEELNSSERSGLMLIRAALRSVPGTPSRKVIFNRLLLENGAPMARQE